MAPRHAKTAGFNLAKLDLCLSFVNTEGRIRNDPPDRLDSLELFLEWAVDKGLAQADWTAQFVGLDPPDAEAFLDRARKFREALYRILTEVCSAGEPDPDDLAVLRHELNALLGDLTLSWEDDAFKWHRRNPAEQLSDLLALIASSAADLLRSDRLDRVKECRSETCSWIFIDESRNRSRCWCDMADCGNRAKARTFYRKHLQADKES